jgi:hypothetical protein
LAKVIQALLLANIGTKSFQQVDEMSPADVNELAKDNVADIASSIWKSSLTEELVHDLDRLSETLKDIKLRHDKNCSERSHNVRRDDAPQIIDDTDDETDDEGDEDLDFGNQQRQLAVDISTTDLITLHQLLKRLFMPQLSRDSDYFDCDRSIKSWLTRFLIVNSLAPKYERDNDRVFIGVHRVTQQLSRLQYWIRGTVLMEIAETLWNPQAQRKTVA